MMDNWSHSTLSEQACDRVDLNDGQKNGLDDSMVEVMLLPFECLESEFSVDVCVVSVIMVQGSLWYHESKKELTMGKKRDVFHSYFSKYIYIKIQHKWQTKSKAR